MITTFHPDTLTAKKRRLHKLEQQQARLGHSTPPEVAIEIEDLDHELASATAVPETDVERFILLRDLILETRSDMRELRRAVFWVLLAFPILILFSIVLAVRL